MNKEIHDYMKEKIKKYDENERRIKHLYEILQGFSKGNPRTIRLFFDSGAKDIRSADYPDLIKEALTGMFIDSLNEEISMLEEENSKL